MTNPLECSNLVIDCTEDRADHSRREEYKKFIKYPESFPALFWETKNSSFTDIDKR